MWKFRSMAVGAEEELEAILRGRPGERLNWAQYQKLWKDPRLTRLGSSLRRWSLDELPQSWNVLRGEMSLVGPRPILPSQQEIYGPLLALYQQVRPGMTGLWQVSGRNRTSFAERVEWDVRYIKGWGLLLDARILVRTLGVLLRGDGAY
jgi:lipopolysaccharide/colanic/teichoic acid biosynthesis glycosyltransferase